jgi:hypothetical protein
MIAEVGRTANSGLQVLSYRFGQLLRGSLHMVKALAC